MPLINKKKKQEQEQKETETTRKEPDGTYSVVEEATGVREVLTKRVDGELVPVDPLAFLVELEKRVSELEKVVTPPTPE